MTTNETEEEKAYMAESLNFINSVDLKYSYKYKDSFTPVLTNIVNDLIAYPSLIEHMKKMIANKRKDNSNSNLKELIVKLTETKKIGPNEYMPIDHNGNNAKYVEQCLKIIGISGSKKVIYELLNLVMQDLKMSENKDLMEKVNSFKKNNQDWKKMVGMLIPPGAQVNILSTVAEPINKFALGKDRNKATVLTSRELIGTVVKRGKLDGILGGNFQKVVRLPKEITRKDNLAYKNDDIMVDPGDIELHDSQPEAGEGAREGAREGTEEAQGREEAPVTEEAAAVVAALVSVPVPVPVDDVTEGASGPESGTGAPSQQPAVDESGIGTEQVNQQQQQQGGQQRITRKHKNSIISSARKSRTYR